MNPFDVKTMKRKSKRLQNRRSVIVRGNGVGGAVAEIPVAVGGTVAEAPVGVDDAVEEVPVAESPVAVGGAVAEPPDLVIEEVLDVVATGEGEVLAEGDERDAVDADVGLVVAEDDDVHDQVPSRSRKKLTPREEMKGRLEAAIEDYKEGNHRSIRQCSLYHKVPWSTLKLMLDNPDMEYKGKGKVSQVFSKDEENRMAAHITERMELGSGMDLLQVQHMMQDCLLVLIAANPQRNSPWADVDPETPWLKHLPTKKFVTTFLNCHRLVFRNSMPLNHGRAILKVEDFRQLYLVLI